ncbi:Response regulator UvrY [Roseovarius litorisediminis]|uniref:Response regulator UvrY n=1 Tax=Roseovarius litorisediminis TaxID=1312363 RepID=A0A1Y5R734_9RHOB|nr:response regulator transcription factor [Roseovarius litorisediminis]SLN10726.1 Response regulator UvrY [Roseovarius litorisediminis]
MRKLLLADDHELVRETIAEFLRLQGGFCVVSANSLDSALATLDKEGPVDLVLLDYAMPGMDALTGLATMKARAGCPVAILTGTAPPDVARRALRAGAAGFLPKTLAPQSLVAAVRHMLSGETYMPLDFLTKIEPDDGRINLTPREKDVLLGISEGKSNKEIARDLDIQEVTVKLHLKTLSRKLGAKNRTHAAMLARDMGLT